MQRATSTRIPILAAVLALLSIPATAQDRKPDLTGIWQVLNTANWNLEGHAAAPGQFPQLGAIGAVAPGLSVVEGDTIPYLPEAAAKKKN